MKLCDILSENVAVGAVGGAAVAGFRGRLFGGPVSRKRIANPKKIEKIRYSKHEKRDTKD